MPLSFKQPYKESCVARSRDFPLTTGTTWSGMWGSHEVWFSLRCSSLPRKPPPPTVRLLPCGTLSQSHPGKSFLHATHRHREKWKWKGKLLSQLCDPTDYKVHSILQAGILEWVTFPFSRGIFPTQGWNPGLPHCGWILYHLSHKGSPRILGWVDYPFSGGSSRPRNRTVVSCIARGFFTNWAMREAHRHSGL